MVLFIFLKENIPVSILYKSIAGRYWLVRVADGPITARYRFIKNASGDVVGTYWKCLAEGLRISIHNICFHGGIKEFFFFFFFLYTLS